MTPIMGYTAQVNYGGIFPIEIRKNVACYHCGKHEPSPDHVAESMSDYFHGKCVADFLITPRGKVFILEGYHAYINDNGVLKQLA